MKRLLFPAAGWLIVFFAIPLLLTAVLSFLSKGRYGAIDWTFTVENYVRMFDPLYLSIYFRSLIMAGGTAALCLAIGLPTALWIARCTPKYRRWILLLVLLPFVTNFIIRSHGIKILLSNSGPLKHLLLAVGIVNVDTSFIGSPMTVWFGMANNFLPFMILPLYSAFEKFDFSLVEAARDLGASRFAAFCKVLLPLNVKPIAAGCTLVFMPALGEFIIPDLLGGAKVMLIGNLITEQFLKSRDWPFGAALSVGLLIAMLLPLLVRLRGRA